MKYILVIFLLSSIFSASIKFDKAVQYLKNNAKKDSGNECGLYVYNALVAAGFNPDLPKDSYQYWSEGLLEDIGYREIKRPNSFKIGDITVTENNYSHPQGHMAMWIGNQWVSDFFQNSEFVYDFNQPPVHYYRYPIDDHGTSSGETVKKTIHEIAIEVIQGKWDNDPIRKQRLEAAGYDYYEVQKEVNRILGYY